MDDLFEPTEERGDAWEHPMDRPQPIPMTQEFVDGYFAAKHALAEGKTQNPYLKGSEAWAGFEEGLVDFAHKGKE